MSDPLEALNAVLEPLGTNLRHYMPVHRDAAIEAMRKVLEAERERIASECDAFDAPPSDSDFVMGQSTAAQQIRAAILKRGGRI